MEKQQRKETGQQNKLRRRMIVFCLLLVILLGAAGTAYGKVWEFGSGGQIGSDGNKIKNQFAPRGYYVDTGKGLHWLSSLYDNSGKEIRYSGYRNGVDYLDAEKENGSGYTFFAMTDHNPLVHQGFLIAYKDDKEIIDLTPYLGTPGRGDEIEPSGESYCWEIPIRGLKLEPGSYYEFAFLQGMIGNNGISLVLAENGKGYLQREDGSFTDASERSRYEQFKNKEYQFVVSYKKVSEDEYKVNTVPMRFSLQTYADLATWEKAERKARKFLNSVTESDFKKGKYKRENVRNFREKLEDLSRQAEDEVKMQRQKQAEQTMRSMVSELNALLKKAQSEKPEPADLSKLKAKLKEAKALYQKASANIGKDKGQYEEIPVKNLHREIQSAEKLDRFSPQRIIDRQVQALDAAMDEVRMGKIREEMRSFYDKATGIIVWAPVTALPENARLFVKRMGESSEEYAAMKKNLSKEEEAAVLYSIQFQEEEYQIQPTKRVEVQVPIDESISQASSTVYEVADDGELTVIPSARSGDVQRFYRNKLRQIALAGSPATEEEKAAAKSKKVQETMKKVKSKKAEQEKNKLAKSKKDKEKYKDPVNEMLKREENLATFSKDVKQDVDPRYLIVIAVVLAIIAVVQGVRAIWSSGRSHETDEKKSVK